MKKIAFLTITLLSVSLLNAQSYFSFGPKVGFTTTTLTTDQYQIKESFATSMHGGVFLRLGSKVFIQPEANFTTKGGILSQNDFFHAREIELSTLEIPVLLGAKVLDLRAANLRIMLGPAMSFILDKDIVMRENFEHLDPEKIKDAMWGIQSGIGVDVLMLTLDVRYEIGLSNLSAVEGIELRNSLFNVSLGWKIF
jgi:hypothetical protein